MADNEYNAYKGRITNIRNIRMPTTPPVRKVACPLCGALPGSNCVKPDLSPLKRRVHWQRVAAYWEAAKRRKDELQPVPWQEIKRAWEEEKQKESPGLPGSGDAEGEGEPT